VADLSHSFIGGKMVEEREGISAPCSAGVDKNSEALASRGMSSVGVALKKVDRSCHVF
jgi:hypothetical protein